MVADWAVSNSIWNFRDLSHWIRNTMTASSGAEASLHQGFQARPHASKAIVGAIAEPTMSLRHDALVGTIIPLTRRHDIYQQVSMISVKHPGTPVRILIMRLLPYWRYQTLTKLGLFTTSQITHEGTSITSLAMPSLANLPDCPSACLSCPPSNRRPCFGPRLS